jgi:tetratricopeptide (TPR) repeat protein
MKISSNNNQNLLNSAYIFFNNGDIVNAENTLKSYDISHSSDFDADFYNLKCIIFFRKKEFNKSLNFIDNAIKINPNCANFYINKANILKELGQFNDSLNYYDIGINLDPNNSRIYFNKALLFIELNNYIEAKTLLEHSISIEPNFYEAYNSLGFIYSFFLEKYNESIFYFSEAIKINPSYLDAHSNLAEALRKVEKYEDAIKHCESVLTKKIDSSKIYNVLANIYVDLFIYDKAIFYYLKAISLDKNFYEAHYNLSIAYKECGLLVDSLTYLDNAIKIKPNYFLALFSKSVLYFLLGDFINAWNFFEYRFKIKNDKYPKYLLSSKPQWDGVKLINCLYVWGEQGIGDQIMYGTVLKDLIFCNLKVFISLDKRLINIFSSAFPNYIFLDKNNLPSNLEFDAHISLGSLAGILRPNIKSFPLINHYVKASEPRKFYGFFNKYKFKCGISWQSNNTHLKKYKNLNLKDFLPILTIPNIQFINLQHQINDDFDDFDYFKKNINFDSLNLEGIDLFNDLDCLVNIIHNCDLIITASNSLAHLAAAMGKKVFVITSFSKGSFWYWREFNGRNVWYSNVRVFSQSKPNDWTTPFTEIKSILEIEANQIK